MNFGQTIEMYGFESSPWAYHYLVELAILILLQLKGFLSSFEHASLILITISWSETEILETKKRAKKSTNNPF